MKWSIWPLKKSILQVSENLKKNKMDKLLEEFSSLNKLIDSLNEHKELLEEINKIKENFDFIDKVWFT